MRQVETELIPELVRRRPFASSPEPVAEAAVRAYPSPRERGLYVALTLVLSLNLVVLFGAVTFCVLVFRQQ